MQLSKIYGRKRFNGNENEIVKYLIVKLNSQLKMTVLTGRSNSCFRYFIRYIIFRLVIK